MTNTYQHAAEITVAGHTIAMQAFSLAFEVRDRAVPDMVAVQPPVPVAEWPVTPEDLGRAAEAKLAEFGLASGCAKEDAVWALEHSDHSDTHYFRRARTAKQAERDQAVARSQWLRGEID